MACRGVYDDLDGFYRHACPPGTKSPRDENLEFDRDENDVIILVEDKGVWTPKGIRIKKGGLGRLKAFEQT